MIPEPLSCPYCNTRVPISAAWQTGQRVPCPRCGELFLYRPGESQGGQTAPAMQTVPAGDALRSRTSAEPGPSPREPVPPPHRLSNRFIAGVIVGVMAIVALLSVVFVWDPDLIRRGDFFLP